MTCIAGFIKNGTTYIGGDSLGSNGYTGSVYKNKKVFHIDNNKNIIVGYTSSFRMGQLLQYSSGLFDELTILKNDMNEKYMVNKFVPNLQKLFSGGGFEEVKSGAKVGGTFLIGIKDRLYEVQNDYSVLESAIGYTACGSGEDFAKSSLYMSDGMDITPAERMRMALKTASKFAVGVAPPFYMVNTETMEVTEL